jgi:hypothetical protein
MNPRTLIIHGLAQLLLGLSALAQPVFLDLKPLFDTDAILEPGGIALSPPLQDERERIDGATLPEAYTNEAVSVTVDGGASFKFAALKQPSLDAMAINGQVLATPQGRYSTVDLALLAAAGSYGDPFTDVQFRYQDGSVASNRFGPVAGWFSSSSAFEHALYAYTDNSNVKTIVSFRADWGDTEAIYLAESQGTGISGGLRFVDNAGYALYRIPIPTDVTDATLGITVGNNFVVSLAAQYADPQVSFTDGFTEVANSMKLYNNFEHRALGNLQLYEFDLKPYLESQTGELYVLFTDATPSNGWGPFIQNIAVYTGKNQVFSQTLVPSVITNLATVYAAFLTDGGTNEKPYLYENSGSGPSNRKHRFADNTGSLTYHFDFPDTVTDAKLTVDMANNFVVALTGPINITRYAQITPGAVDENSYLVDDGSSILGNGYRYADASAYMIYQFDLPDDLTTAVAQINVGNQFVIEAAAGTNGEFVLERDYVAETGDEIRDNSNLGAVNIKLDPYLTNNASKIVQFRLSDGLPADGWGPYLTSITIVNRTNIVKPVYQTVLDSMTMFGTDIHDEINKDYYTIDLSSVLKTNNPKKEVYVKFTDGSTADGWGPGIFWMAAYSGTIDIQGDRPVFNGLKAMDGQPSTLGVNLMWRRYLLDDAKTLKEIVLPAQPAIESDRAYLLAATLNAPAADAVLAARMVSGSQVRISWPASLSGYYLITTPQLGSQWTIASQNPVAEGAEWAVYVPTTAGTHLYQLRK